jgi:hypothetical protein
MGMCDPLDSLTLHAHSITANTINSDNHFTTGQKPGFSNAKAAVATLVHSRI